MRLGCAIHTLTNNPNAYEDAMYTIASLGFSGYELIAFSETELEEYYTTAQCSKLRHLAESKNMELTEFILYAPLVEGLTQDDQTAKDHAYDLFEKGLKKAKLLGTDIINIVSNWPSNVKAPIDYLPSFIHPNTRGVYSFEPKLKMEMPSGFDARAIWDVYMQSLTHLAEMTNSYGMRFALEGHANVIVGTTDAFMRMFDRITLSCFGTNFDACWQLVQREYLPWSVYKLRERIFHVHVRDGDGLSCYSLQPGDGIIDWNGLVRALKEVDYQGYLSFETGGYANPIPYLKKGKAYLEEVLRQEDAIS